MTDRPIRVRAPASVSNLGCGFDALGLALESPADTVTARWAEGGGVTMGTIRGDGGRLPREAERNTATVAAGACLELAGATLPAGRGVILDLDKGLPLSSGLGGSAASAVAAAVAVDALAGLKLPTGLLLQAAVRGEAVASGAPHGDNAAPALMGGFVLVRSKEPLEVIPLPAPGELAVALLYPRLEVETRTARSILPASIPLEDAVTQWGNLAAMVDALHRGDLEMVGRCVVDAVAEPARKHLVPGFDAVVAAARGAGALGAGLSGAGPTLFALCRGAEAAATVAIAMERAFRDESDLPCRAWSSPVSRRGAEIVP